MTSRPSSAASWASTSSDPAALAALQAHDGIILGPVMFGMYITAFMSGWLAMQFSEWTTSVRARNESRVIQCLAHSLFVVSMGMVVFVLALSLHLFTDDFGDYSGFSSTSWTSYAVLVDALVIAAVQSYFAYTAYTLRGKDRVLAVTLLTLILLGFVGAIGTFAMQKMSFTASDQPNGFTYSWLGGTTATNHVLTAVLAFSLIRSASATWRKNPTRLARLKALAVDAQVMPAASSGIFLASYIAYPSSNVNVCFELVSSIFYVCNLFAALNSRAPARTQGDADADIGLANDTYRLRPARQTQTTVHIATKTYVTSQSLHPHEPRLGLNRQPYSPYGFDDVDGKGQAQPEGLSSPHVAYGQRYAQPSASPGCTESMEGSGTL